ncbi:hypothetical protein, partial [Winogradskyella vincentii]
MKDLLKSILLLTLCLHLSITVNAQQKEYVSTQKKAQLTTTGPSAFDLLIEKIYNEKLPTSGINSLVITYKEEKKKTGNGIIIVNRKKSSKKKKVTPPSTKDNTYQTLKLKNKGYNTAPPKGGIKKTTSVYDNVPTKKNNTYQTLKLDKNGYDTAPVKNIKKSSKTENYDNPGRPLSTNKNPTLLNYDQPPKANNKITSNKSNTYDRVTPPLSKKGNTYDNVNSSLSKNSNSYGTLPL